MKNILEEIKKLKCSYQKLLDMIKNISISNNSYWSSTNW
jgi:hypothetical protein